MFLECFGSPQWITGEPWIEWYAAIVTSVECSPTLNFSCSSKQPFCVMYVMGSMSINIHHTRDTTRLSYTNAVSANYFLSVCAGCDVSQSCVITILNKLPNLTALNFDRIDLPANEWEVSVHNVQMQCSCVCSDTASTACLCVHSLVCQRSQEGRGVQYLQPSFMAVDIPILPCTHAVNPIVHPKYLQ